MKLLQKFLDTCSASKVMIFFQILTSAVGYDSHVGLIFYFFFVRMKQVKVDLLLGESDQTVKAILDLMPVLSITKLVLGTTKLSLRYNIQLYNNNQFTPPIISNPNSLEFGFGREWKRGTRGAFDKWVLRLRDLPEHLNPAPSSLISYPNFIEFRQEKIKSRIKIFYYYLFFWK
jgi:hypothetical protein